MIDPNARDSLGEEVQDMLKGWLSANGKTGLGCINGRILCDLINEKLGRRWQRKKAPVKRVLVTDEQWMADLKADPANRGIDVDAQFRLAGLWCRQQRPERRCSRAFFLNWLIRHAQTVPLSGKAIETPKNSLLEPQGWYTTMQTNYPDWIALKDNATPSWSDLTSGQKEDVCRIMKTA